MRALIQRVSEASVSVDGEIVGEIEQGILLFLAVVVGDSGQQCSKMVRKVAGLRIFPDQQGRMNLSVKDICGKILVVSQFTLAADLKKGYRPSFGQAQEPKLAAAMCKDFCQELAETGIEVEQGIFGADMRVALVNDGPVTFWLDFPPQPVVV
ncbi:MAG: D-tyrosyl-tRNA(Tyr) deacylase [Magnetococcales bacterium]|nr:D-tyrosyl-tRNA(Tyr) deacylase [Magnetococcales bacterium]